MFDCLVKLKLFVGNNYRDNLLDIIGLLDRHKMEVCTELRNIQSHCSQKTHSMFSYSDFMTNDFV